MTRRSQTRRNFGWSLGWTRPRTHSRRPGASRVRRRRPRPATSTPKPVKNYSGMSPITKASGTKRVVLARFARNHRLGDALFLQAFAATQQLPRRPRVLRPLSRSRSHPLPSSPSPREPARRHPPRLPANPHPLQRTPRMAHRTGQTKHRSLTTSGRGMSSQAPPVGLEPTTLRFIDHAVHCFVNNDRQWL
jgi:hypothetical protein